MVTCSNRAIPFFTIGMKNTLVLAGSIIIAGVFIGGGIYLSKVPTSKTIIETTPSAPQKELTIKEVQADDYIIGPKNADLTLIEYSDPECPWCKRFHNTMIELTTDKDFVGKLAWVYRHFPVDTLHKKARYESEAMECAGIVGGNEGFWRFTNKIYNIATSNDTLDTSILPALAEGEGLPKDTFTSCLTKGDAKAKVERDYQEAISAGGLGTPYSIIVSNKPFTKTQINAMKAVSLSSQNAVVIYGTNKIIVNGAQPIEILRKALDAVLK